MDKICKLNITMTAGGESYPCESVNFSAKINDFVRFSAVVTGKKGNGATMLTVNDIRNLAAKLQKQMFKDPREGQFTIHVQGCGKDLKVKGLISSVELIANTSGGLKLSITGTSADSLMDMYNGSIYLKNINPELIQSMLSADTPIMGKFYTIPTTPKGGLSERITTLITNAHKSWNKAYPNNTLISGEKTIIEKSDEVNNEIYEKQIKPFLKNIDVKIYDGKVDLDDQLISRVVNDGLHNYLFDSGYSFFSALVNGICRDFALWYVPLQDKEWKSGTLIPQKYGDDKVDGDLEIAVSSMNVSSGNRIGGRAPCIGVGVLGTLYGAQLNETFQTANSNKLYVTYPKEPKRKFGSIYTFQAPTWITVPAMNMNEMAQKALLAKAQEQQPYKDGRNISNVTKSREAQAKHIKKSVDKTDTILDYLAQKWYYRALLEDSNAEITGPYTGMIEANIGDQVNVKAMNGGTILTGVLYSIDYALSATNGGSTKINIALAKFPGVKIE